MKKSKNKLLTATALAATLAIAAVPTTSVFAAEQESPIQNEEANHVFSQKFMNQLKQLSNSPFEMHNLDLAVQAALVGPEVKKLSVFDHEFNVKPAYISKVGDKTLVNGQISHHLSFRPDDQLYYRFVKENGEIKDLEIKIDRGGWTKIAAPIGAILAAYNGLPIKPDLLEKIGQQLGGVIDGKWEYAAEAIVAAIGLYVE
ncbi:hypothetical protein [Bacillus cereus]|uniref:Methyltransferase n=1 Tax=Bacillus cereus VD184 TaxID=1053242 RepID=A0A9W5R607_BACCE|nr:hypothetical protein [Bacillus cereus]EOQ10167.1 hypothetical protein IKC_05750 [Bacillus cereus VD184]